MPSLHLLSMCDKYESPDVDDLFYLMFIFLFPCSFRVGQYSLVHEYMNTWNKKKKINMVYLMLVIILMKFYQYNIIYFVKFIMFINFLILYIIIDYYRLNSKLSN